MGVAQTDPYILYERRASQQKLASESIETRLVKTKVRRSATKEYHPIMISTNKKESQWEQPRAPSQFASTNNPSATASKGQSRAVTELDQGNGGMH